MSDFLEKIPARLRPTIHTFCTDMWEGYLTAIAEFSVKHHLEKATTVIDRFHVTQHYREGFDALRKQETRRLKQELPVETYRTDFQGALWLLRHNYNDLDGRELARGISRYSSEDMTHIAGHHSDQIIELLGYAYGPVVVHRNDMILL